MRVLITNITLAGQTGTEVNVRDIARGLQRRGHTPVVYSPDLGPLADGLRRKGIPTVDDLNQLAVPPDVIHGHHHPETMLALQRFPDAPAIFFSHDSSAWHDAAPHFPRLRRYVGVDAANVDRLVLEHGVPPTAVRLILNAVDCERFRPRPPLPRTPVRAVVFSNYASERVEALALRDACARRGLSLDFIGEAMGAHHAAPEDVLPEYDLVFAKGRCALEAMAVGAAVVLVDFMGAGAMVTRATVEALRQDNFGRRVLQRPLAPTLLAAEIARYDAADATAVGEWIRTHATLDRQLDELLALYSEVIAEHAQQPVDREAEGRAAAAYYRQWGPRAREGELRTECDRRWHEIARVTAERDEWRQAYERLRSEHAMAAGASARALLDERDRLAAELASMRRTATWRLRDRLLGIPPLVRLYRWLRRVAAASSGP